MWDAGTVDFRGGRGSKLVGMVSYGVDYVSALDARQCKGYLE